MSYCRSLLCTRRLFCPCDWCSGCTWPEFARGVTYYFSIGGKCHRRETADKLSAAAKLQQEAKVAVCTPKKVAAADRRHPLLDYIPGWQARYEQAAEQVAQAIWAGVPEEDRLIILLVSYETYWKRSEVPGSLEGRQIDTMRILNPRVAEGLVQLSISKDGCLEMS